MSGKKKIILYVAWGLCAFIIFIYALFPKDKVKAYAQDAFSRAFPEYSLSISGASLSLPLGVTFSDIKVSSAKGMLAASEKLKVSLSPFSLFSGKRVYSLKGSVAQGRVTAKIVRPKNGPPGFWDVSARISGVHAEKMRAFWNMLGGDVSGTLDGSFSFSGQAADWTRQQGEASLSLSNGKFSFLSQFLGVDAIPATRLLLGFSMKDGSVTIKNCTLESSQLKGGLSGGLRLRKPFSSSELDITGTVSATPEFFRKAGARPEMVQFMQSKQRAGGVAFSITGPMATKRIAFK